MKAGIDYEMSNMWQEDKGAADDMRGLHDTRTDGNIKGAMESILRIADRLKRREQSGRVQTQNSKSEVAHSRKNI